MTGPVDRLTRSKPWRVASDLSTAQFLWIVLGAGIGTVAGALINVATPLLTAPLYVQLLAFAGSLLAGVAALLLVALAITQLAGSRIRSTSAPPAIAEQVTPELIEARARLAELEAATLAQRDEERLNRIAELENEAARLLEERKRPEMMARPRSEGGPADARIIDNFDRNVRKTIDDEPDDIAFYDRPPGDGVLNGLEWQERNHALLGMRQDRPGELRWRHKDRINARSARNQP